MTKYKFDLQKFGGTGVFPVHNNIFKINTAGRTLPGTMVTIKDLETFSVSVDGNTEEWTPMDQEGWIRRAVTGKGLTISFSGKRHYGDPGNDYIGQDCFLETGQGVESIFEWEMPSGAKLSFNCIVNVTSPGGGDSTNIDGLEFEILSDGKPNFTPADGGLGTLIFECSEGSVSGTQIEAVVPVIGAGNSYLYKINGSLPRLDENMTGKGWATYVLGTDIDTTAGNNIALVEVVTSTNLAKKGGIAPAVV
jgi:hypothetical protein